ncbi:hypothetical protein J5A58_06130 [Prevotella melaninogenica]|uniref:Uncharacterized protein n=1 Tax=Prevotella melaninogenica TaxID=28132 RepID=A0ABX7XNM2_9BACT|nr:hypothetical protein [Prevotella melaninogenica]QUB75113.1 hypothetical protein J5A58_06130 [Prevotella melaninogenica]
MHTNVQTRFNPATGDMAPYYRIKESYRDVQGHVHCKHPKIAVLPLHKKPLYD